MLTALAALCLILGAATVLLPLPTGVPLIALGLFILMASNRRFSGFIRLLRRRLRWLDRAFRWVEDRTSGRFAATLLRTRPRASAVPRACPLEIDRNGTKRP